MSRVGKNPINVPSDVKVNILDGLIEVSGKLGKLTMPINEAVTVIMNDNIITVSPANRSKNARMNWGTVQRRISNMVSDVSKGVTINLEMIGVGYKAQVQGRDLNLQVGYSHDVVYSLPTGVNAVCPKPTNIDISGYDRQLVGQVVAEICQYRPSEPYKGKGINKVGKVILRKEGKKK